jgi:formylglycine-generating enzyme required for sulfatase activity
MTEQQFDVFLCHNSEDKPAVIQIAQQLQQNNLKPWLDVWELQPGAIWQYSLEQQIERIGAVAVFVGQQGLGPWQSEEIYAFLQEFISRKCPVIPVMLADAPEQPKLPIFLRNRHWVDFRLQAPDPLVQLVWGITGLRPSAPLDTAQVISAQTAATLSVSNPPYPVGWAPPTTPPSQPANPSQQPPSPWRASDSPAANLTFSFEVVTVNAQGKVAEKTSKTAEYRREDLGNGITLDMVKIPGGRFQMGSPASEDGRAGDEGPQHSVTVPEFWLGKYAVTQAQYQAVMGTNPSVFSENGANRPVERVSWQDAAAFCKKLSQQTGRTYRLPSEAEWEYACRAGTTTPFHFGATMTTDLANYNGNYIYDLGPKGVYREQTTEVGSFPANAFGLRDMHGNVWEWCADHWHDNYEGAPTDGAAWLSSDESGSRLLRGGSWNDYPRDCCSAGRYWDARDGRDDLIGLRLVCASSWAL